MATDREHLGPLYFFGASSIYIRRYGITGIILFMATLFGKINKNYDSG
jgi:hypothetical protein